MDYPIVRLQEINIFNLKKVRKSDVAFPSYKREEFFSRESDVLAIFGQEGSGRSSLVNALWILKNSLLGEPFFDDIEEYIWDDTKYFDIRFTFSIEFEEDRYLIFYHIYFDKVDGISIKEFISWKKFVGNESTARRKFKIDYSENNVNIFSADLKKIEVSSFDNEKFRKIILALKNYARNDLNIFRKKITPSILNSNLVKLIESKDDLFSKNKSVNYLIPYNHPVIVKNDLINNIEGLTYNISKVLNKEFPNISVLATETNDLKESKFINLKLISEDKSKSLKNKSKEIKNLISIMIILMPITEKASTCVVIDKLEIDKIGDFKYKLAELINNEAKGQMLIITNDFKFLNQFDERSLIYTTWNPEKRYKKFERITSIDDTKKFYYRSLYIKDKNKKFKKAH
ncbi:MAG: hypothetical protein ACOCV1_08735 [Bacillota bacterium]